jgi:putative ABC transport system permease protein
VIAYIVRSLLRNKTRSILTIGAVALTTFIFCFVRAIDSGMDKLLSSSGAEKKLIVYHKNRFCYATSKLLERYVPRIAEIPGVERVLPLKVYVSNCRASLDIVTFEGGPVDELLASRPIKVVAGDLEQFKRDEDAALVGVALAKRRGLTPGMKFRVGNVLVNVTAIVESGSSVDDNIAFTHLGYLQRIPGLNSVGYVTQIEVFLKDPSRAEAIAKQIDDMFATDESPTDTKPERAFLARKTRDLAEVVSFARVLGYVCVLVMLAILANTVVMAVQDRVRELAMLQAVGYDVPRVAAIVLAESALAAFVGGVIGAGVAALVLWWTRLGIATEGIQVEFALSFGSIGVGVISSTLAGGVAGIVPAWHASHLEIADALRSL